MERDPGLDGRFLSGGVTSEVSETVHNWVSELRYVVYSRNVKLGNSKSFLEAVLLKKVSWFRPQRSNVSRVTPEFIGRLNRSLH